MRRALLLAALLWTSPSRSATIAGRDCAGGKLVCDGATAVCGSAQLCSSGDELQGTFTRVDLFSLPAGTTVFVFPATPLAVYASTISIAGLLDGTGRGLFGGGNGPENGAGLAGSGSGRGSGGTAGKGGGGGGHGGWGGLGSGLNSNASSGTPYGASFEVTSPISADDIDMGSGGGGGGGGGANHGSGAAGATGGASVYLEASSMTLSGGGSIVADGGAAAAATDPQFSAGAHPGGGGGGSGGGILLRVAGRLDASGTGRLSAKGGKGSDIATQSGGPVNPGPGGGGGRIKVFAGSAGFGIAISTGFGTVGGKFPVANFESTGTANLGSSGTVAFGIVASSPIAPTITAVHLTSVTYSWGVGISTWGSANEASRRFHVFASSSLAPLPAPQVEVSSFAAAATERFMAPNSSYTRVVTAFTTWGESLPSLPVSTVTLASPPGPPVGVSTFTNVQERQLTLNWGHGSAAEANPSYTEYEVWRSTLSDFSVASSTRLVAVSSTPLSLVPETVYYFRVRAVSLAGTLTAFTTTFSIATSTTPPVAPGAPVPASPYSYDGRAVFRWAAGSAPSGIKEYHLEIGSFPGGGDFLSQSVGNALSYEAVGLASGKTYYARARARSNANVDSDFSSAGSGVSVFVTAQEKPLAKPAAWPNPFDPTSGPANIGFSLAEPATVTLRIFTLNGRLVYQEERRFGAAGNQVWTWNGASGSGLRVAPGGYLIVIEKRYAGGTETQRSKLAILY